eukprot:232930_1
MAMALLILVLLFDICFGSNSSIITWETEIINKVSNHKIPLKVHYPNSSSANNKYPIMIFNHGGDTKIRGMILYGKIWCHRDILLQCLVIIKNISMIYIMR